MSIASSLLTAAEFGRLPDPGHPQELVRGVVVNRPPPKLRHGQVCGNVYHYLRIFVDQNRLGHVVPNDTGVITEQEPDTVRGMDVAFISYNKIPSGPLPKDYLKTAPDAVFEVRSPSDRWKYIHQKVAEYLDLGVPAVYVLDPDSERVHCYSLDQPDEILTRGEELVVGDGPLAGFRVPVAKLFE
jgi:Uma2 family endonuclease